MAKNNGLQKKLRPYLSARNKKWLKKLMLNINFLSHFLFIFLLIKQDRQ